MGVSVDRSPQETDDAGVFLGTCGWTMKKIGSGASGDAVPRSVLHTGRQPAWVQAHGVVLVVDPATGSVRQASENAAAILGVPTAALIGETLDVLGGDLASQARVRLRGGVGPSPEVFFATTRSHRGAGFGVAGLLHRNRDGAVVIEVLPSRLPDATSYSQGLPDQLAAAIGQLGQATRLGELADAAARLHRELTGFERVTLYRLPIAGSGAGEVVGESLAPGLESWLGVGFLELDALGAGRDEVLFSRVRSVADVDEADVSLVPPLLEPTGNPPDLARAMFTAMHPALRAHVRASGSRAGFFSAIVRDGTPWGFVAGYHRSPRRLDPAVRAACDLVAELVATRIAVIENLARVAASASVRRLDEHLVARTLSGGLWQDVVLEDAAELLALAGADGMALFAEGRVRCEGSVPPEPALRNLALWIASQPMSDGVLVRDSMPGAASGVPASLAAGVLAVSLSRPGGEFLMWFRGEQVRDIRSADAPAQAVRGACKPWSSADVAAARAVAVVLRDVSVQVRSLSYLLMGERLADLSRALQDTDDGVLIADGAGQVRFTNDALRRFFDGAPAEPRRLEDVLASLAESASARELADALLEQRQSWQGEVTLAAGSLAGMPVAVRAEVIPRIDGYGLLGAIVLFTDLTARRADEEARARAREALRVAQGPLVTLRAHPALVAGEASLVEAVSATASLAVLEVAHQGSASDVARTLEGLGASSRRAAELALQVLALAGTRPLDGAER